MTWQAGAAVELKLHVPSYILFPSAPSFPISNGFEPLLRQIAHFLSNTHDYGAHTALLKTFPLLGLIEFPVLIADYGLEFS